MTETTETLKAEAVKALDALVELVGTREHQVEGLLTELAVAHDEIERLEDRLEGEGRVAAKLVNHLHQAQKHSGTVSLCSARFCTEAVDYLRMEAGVQVR